MPYKNHPRADTPIGQVVTNPLTYVSPVAGLAMYAMRLHPFSPGKLYRASRGAGMQYFRMTQPEAYRAYHEAARPIVPPTLLQMYEDLGRRYGELRQKQQFDSNPSYP